MHPYAIRLLALTLASLPLVACGGDDDDKKPPCDAVENTGCADDQTCEFVTDGSTICAAPVLLRGLVYDLGDDAPVEGAHIVALDVNRAPVSSVAITDADGGYQLAIPHKRDARGKPVPLALTLRADAQGFQTFPSGIRQALPIDTTTTTPEAGKLFVENALTSVGLIELPEGAGTGSISGRVALPKNRPGILVVAEAGGVGTSAIADRDGNYAILNLPDGAYELNAFTRGASFTPATATVEAETDTVVDLALSNAATSRLSGKVSIVNPGAGKATSIILVLESLFDETALQGESPPGLRAPNGGVAPDVTGDFSIDGIPAGRYVILAAFENDNLVRDPDTTIGGTSIVRQTIEAGQDVTLAESFKITGALDFLAPLGLQPLGVTTAPAISWEDDSSEDGYELTVYDALGDIVWEHDEPSHSGSTPTVTYGGPLDPGMYYQVKILSIKAGVPISATEDLAGIFFVDTP